MRRFLTARWPVLTGAAATVAYGVAVLGFGLVYRPLHNDEGVTLAVASHVSARQVLDIAVNYRHGPPLHYLLVHASLLWRDDMLGLRLPSALLGILTVALAYGFGRELLGRYGGAPVAVIVASSPVVVHLGQFARGYTAMLAGSFGSLWLLLVLLRTRRGRYIAPYALSALLLAAAHPFGLFALASELVILALLGIAPLVTRWREQQRTLVTLAAALLAAAVALAVLWHVYAQLQTKYGVGAGRPVIQLGSSGFWRRLSDAWSGSTVALAGLSLAAATVAGLVVLLVRDRRAGLVVAVWLVQPIASLAVLTATSPDFAPERHLSFLIPGYAAALAGFLLEVARRLGRRGPWLATALGAALLAPGVVALVNDIGTFTPDLRDASLYLGADFGQQDVLLSTGGVPEHGVDPRLYGAYAALEAPAGSPLADWRDVGQEGQCALVATLEQHPAPDGAWLMLRAPDPGALGVRLEVLGFQQIREFGQYVVARFPLESHTTVAALTAGLRGYGAAKLLSPDIGDFRELVAIYRLARADARSSAICPPPASVS
jgi:Dolichyl-phosphate-mannose-protein mannosyltransferase